MKKQNTVNSRKQDFLHYEGEGDSLHDFQTHQMLPRSQSQAQRPMDVRFKPFESSLEQGDQRGGGITYSFEMFNQRRQRRSRLQTITSRFEEIKNKPSLQGCGKDTILTIVAIVIVIAILTSLIVYYWNSITMMIEPFFDLFEKYIYQGIFLYTLIYIAMVVVFLPTTFLTYGGALAFAHCIGPVASFFLTTILVVIANQIGGTIAFVLARFFMRDFIRRKLTRKVKLFRAIDLGLKHNGFKLVFLMRLTPIMPYNVMNYMMGVTSLRIKDFTLGGLGMFPLTAINVYLGVQLNSVQDIMDGTQNLGPWQPVLITLGACLVVFITSLLTSYSNDELQKLLKDEALMKTPLNMSQASPDNAHNKMRKSEQNEFFQFDNN